MEENKDNNDKNEEISIEKSNKKPSNNNGNKNIKKDLSLSDNSLPQIFKNRFDIKQTIISEDDLYELKDNSETSKTKNSKESEKDLYILENFSDLSNNKNSKESENDLYKIENFSDLSNNKNSHESENDLFEIKYGSEQSLSQNNNNQESENDLYELKYNSEQSLKNVKISPKQKPISEIFYIKDIKDFEPEEYSVRKYDKNNIEFGKKFFTYRFIKKKLEQSIEKKDFRASISFKKRFENMSGKRNTITTSKYHNMGINTINEEIFNNKSEYRKYNSEFLLLLEKSIISFNFKKYDESFSILFKKEIINSKKEFGEFLLVVNGYNKNVLGTFLAKDKPPNDKKEIVNSFINSIDLTFSPKSRKVNKFLECLRFFLSRLILPGDSSLILEIMNIYSTCLFNTNKNNKDFVSKYSSSNNIYLLISTILAVNTMITRKDIKNINMIKKDEFVEMNNEIDKKEAKNIYEELENNPLSISDNYSENNYKRMTILVKKKDIKKYNSNNKKSINEKEEEKEEKNKNENNNEVIEDINENIKINDIIKNNKTLSSKIGENSSKKREIKQLKRYPTSSKLYNKSIFNILEEKDESDIDYFVRTTSFSYQENLESFSEKDREILTKPTKFNKLISKSSHHDRTFVVTDNLEKLTWAKEIEVTICPDENVKVKKSKGNIRNLLIKDIEDVYNGINNSNVIANYVKAYPEEGKEANNFITIKTPNKTIYLKAYNQENGLSWFKALKSLVLQKKENNKIDKNQIKDKDKDKFQKTINNFWKDILRNWEKYGHYFQYKIQNKINEKNRIYKREDSLEEKNTFSFKDKDKFINTIKKKLSGNNNILDYNEFFQLYNIGIPNVLRGKLWSLLIDNSCGITLNLYNSYANLINKIDFEELINDYEEKNNLNQELLDIDYNIDIKQLLIDIKEIKSKFVSKINNVNELLLKVYKIVRIFYSMRPDINYNKSLIAFSFLFLSVCDDEFTAFRNIFNLICSTNILQFHIKNELFINIRVKFFDDILKNKIPKVSKHFKNLDISTELFLVSWFENLYTFTFDVILLKKIFDLYLLNGEYILFQVGLTIIKIQENELLNLTIGEVFKNLNKLPEHYNEELFMETMDLNNIYEEYEKWKIDSDVGNQKIKLLEFSFNE